MARYPGAIWRPCPKHGYAGNDTHLWQGLVIHSAEGSLAGLFSVLDGAREASWHFSVAQDGRVYQHVDTNNIAWTNGSQQANTKFWGIECEGGGPGNRGEPLTEPQYQALVGVVRWLWDTHGQSVFVRQQTLWEHREMTRFGATATSCPSGRIPWTRLISDLEDDMTQTEFNEMFLEAVKTVGIPRDSRETGSQVFHNWATLARIAQTLWDHTHDNAKHGGGVGYSDADAVRAVKNKL